MRKFNCFNWLSVLILLFVFAGCAEDLVDENNGSPQRAKLMAEEKFSFSYFTDVHLNKDNLGNGNDGLRLALTNAKSKKVDFVLFGGDNTDSDGLGNAEQVANDLQERFKNIVDESGLPAYFTIGNHDRYYRENGSVDRLGFKLFEKRFGATYRSFTHKGVHFITLNTMYPSAGGAYSINPEQLEWLRNDLQATGTETPVVISLHVPMLSLYYPVVEGNFKPLDMISNTKEVFDLLDTYNVKLVLQGHQHIYEQIHQRDKWFVTAGAVSAYWWKGPFLRTQEGYLLVHVDVNNNFSWEYVDYGWNAV